RRRASPSGTGDAPPGAGPGRRAPRPLRLAAGRGDDLGAGRGRRRLDHRELRRADRDPERWPHPRERGPRRGLRRAREARHLPRRTGQVRLAEREAEDPCVRAAGAFGHRCARTAVALRDVDARRVRRDQDRRRGPDGDREAGLPHRVRRAARAQRLQRSRRALLERHRRRLGGADPALLGDGARARGTVADGVLRRLRGLDGEMRDRTVPAAYMQVAEKDRQRFAEREHIFAEYLPYAIVFRCVDQWAKAFEGIDLKEVAASWYSGNLAAFTAMDLSRDLSSLSEQVSTAI